MDTLELDLLIERAASEAANTSRDAANEREELWKNSERRQREKRREEHRLAWYSHEMHMCELHASLSEEHRVKALTFLKQREGGRR